MCCRCYRDFSFFFFFKIFDLFFVGLNINRAFCCVLFLFRIYRKKNDGSFFIHYCLNLFVCDAFAGLNRFLTVDFSFLLCIFSGFAHRIFPLSAWKVLFFFYLNPALTDYYCLAIYRSYILACTTIQKQYFLLGISPLF